VHSFSETDKLSYSGIADDGWSFPSTSTEQEIQLIIFCVDNMFHFTCFNVDDPNDPSVGLVDGQLSIPGILLRREV
jgi:hypothetical protein